MTEMDEPTRIAVRSAANLRRMTKLGFALDIVVALILILFKDGLQIGDLAYFIAGLLVASGFVMLIFIPKLPEMSLRRYERNLELVDEKWNKIQKK